MNKHYEILHGKGSLNEQGEEGAAYLQQKTFWRDGYEYAINPENGKEYKLAPDPFKLPHLAKLKQEAETVIPRTSNYWKLRCRYLEKTIDETYSVAERNNCRTLYLILLKREL